MGVGRPVLPSAFASRTSEGTVSLGAEQARPPGSRPGGGARGLVMTALAVAAVLGLAACSGGNPSPSSSPGPGATALPTTPASASQTLSETGSSLMEPLFARWGAAYQVQIAKIKG
jgi:hypothetical protein